MEEWGGGKPRAWLPPKVKSLPLSAWKVKNKKVHGGLTFEKMVSDLLSVSVQQAVGGGTRFRCCERQAGVQLCHRPRADLPCHDGHPGRVAPPLQIAPSRLRDSRLFSVGML